MEGLSAMNGHANGHSMWPTPLTEFDPKQVGGPLSDFQRPVRIEGDIFNLEVQGEIPKGIAGTFYRIMPDPMFPPYIRNDNVR